MSTVNVTLALTPLSVPADTDVSSVIRMLLLAASGTIVKTAEITLPALTCAFDGVADGNYTVQAQRMTTFWHPIGTPATASVTVSTPAPAAPIVIDVPGSMTVTVAP